MGTGHIACPRKKTKELEVDPASELEEATFVVGTAGDTTLRSEDLGIAATRYRVEGVKLGCLDVEVVVVGYVEGLST